VFLDRDGTLIEERGYLDRMELLSLFPWTADALRLLARAGFEVLATFHQLDERFSKGEPVRMRMLARKGTGAVAAAGAEPIAALRPVVDAYVSLREAARALKNVAS
jgi:hypothetical protein